VAPLQQDVLRLDVAVDDPLAVGVLERVGDFAGDPERLVHRELLLALQPVAERLALHEGHGVEEVLGDQAIGRLGDWVDRRSEGAAVEQGEDVGMMQAGRQRDLTQEPLTAQHGGEFGPEHLERDLPLVLEVSGEVDRGHAAAPELALERVAAGEGRREALQGVGHTG
jgi:hypothetical protein